MIRELDIGELGWAPTIDRYEAFDFEHRIWVDALLLSHRALPWMFYFEDMNELDEYLQQDNDGVLMFVRRPDELGMLRLKGQDNG